MSVREQILCAAINHFGPGAQQIKAIEELSELIQALAKSDRDNIAEEMADVRIMLEQLMMAFDLHLKVEDWEAKKVARLENNL